MAIGGFNGSDPSPTLEEFQALVASGDDPLLHRVRRHRRRTRDGRERLDPSRDLDLDRGHFTAQTIGGVTIYDLSGGWA